MTAKRQGKSSLPRRRGRTPVTQSRGREVDISETQFIRQPDITRRIRFGSQHVNHLSGQMKIKYLQDQLVMKDSIFDFSTAPKIHNYTPPQKTPPSSPIMKQITQTPNHHPRQDATNEAQDQFGIQVTTTSFVYSTTLRAHTHTSPPASPSSSITQMPHHRSSSIEAKRYTRVAARVYLYSMYFCSKFLSSPSPCKGRTSGQQKDHFAPSAIWGPTGTAADSAGGSHE